MAYVAIALVLALIFAGWLLHAERRAHHKALLDLSATFAAERGELLTRIQRPDFIPRPRVPRPERAETERVVEHGDYHRVGVAQPMRDLSERPAADG